MKALAIAWRIPVAAACLYGIWLSWTLARADSLFRKDTAESVRAAIQLDPNEPRILHASCTA